MKIPNLSLSAAKMKMATFLSIFRMSFWRRWIGKKEQPLTSMYLEIDSSYGKLFVMTEEMLDLIFREMDELEEQLRLRDLAENPEYDV